MKILIVDDSMVIRRKIERCEFLANLAADDDDIKQASNGLEAMSIFSQFKPDLVTMDLTMPEMDGVECVKKMIEEEPESTNILVVSALNDKDTALQAIRNGARGFLPKPFTEEQLSESLRQVLKKS